MCGFISIKLKILPSSPEVNLSKISKDAEKILIEKGAKNISCEEKIIAFGLKALYFKFVWPEKKDSLVYEKALKKIKEIGSIETEDYRRLIE